MNTAIIENFLASYGQALSAGDIDRVTHYWAVPALVVSDQGTMAVTDSQQVRDFFSQAVRMYHSKGMMSTSPILERFELLSPTLVSVDIRWPALDASGTEVAREYSRYVLSLQEGSDPQICVAVILPP